MQETRENAVAKVWFMGKNQTIPGNVFVPEELVGIQETWREKCDELAKADNTVCASINFQFQGVRYEMAPPSENRLIWESTLPEIKEMLKEAGAEDIQYVLVSMTGQTKTAIT